MAYFHYFQFVAKWGSILYHTSKGGSFLYWPQLESIHLSLSVHLIYGSAPLPPDSKMSYYQRQSWGNLVGCPRIHLNHVTKLCVCPTELHGSKTNPKNFGQNKKISRPPLEHGSCDGQHWYVKKLFLA